MSRVLSCVVGFAVMSGVSVGPVGAQLPDFTADVIMMPSGHTAKPFDLVWDEDQSVIRPRYIVEELSYPGSAYANNVFAVFDDMLWLCNTQIRSLFAPDELPQSQGWEGAIITMMSAPLEFGTRDPDVTQFFESFLFAEDGCALDDEYHD